MTTRKNITLIIDGIVEALEGLVLPRFDKMDGRFDKMDGDVAELKQAVEILDSDMGGVKMRLKVVWTRYSFICSHLGFEFYQKW